MSEQDENTQGGEQLLTEGERAEVEEAVAHDVDGALGRIVTTSLDDLIDFAEFGHIHMAPVILTHDCGTMITRHVHGFHVLAEHPLGRFLLESHDYHMFDPVRQVDLESGAALDGFYINSDNAQHIDVIYGHERADGERWMINMIEQHNYWKTEELKQYGYLEQVSENMYVSGSVAYVVHELLENQCQKEMKKIIKRLPDYDGSEPLYKVSCYTMGGKGSEFARFDEEFLESGWGRALSLTAESAYATRAQIEDYIAEDFNLRAQLIERNEHPAQVGYFDKPELQSRLFPVRKRFWAWGAYQGKSLLGSVVNSVYSSYAKLPSHENSKNASPVKKFFKFGVRLVSAVLKAGMTYFMRGGPAALIKVFVDIAQPVIRKLTTLFKKEQSVGVFHRNKNIDYKLWDKRLKPSVARQSDSHPLDPDEAVFCRILREDETSARPLTGMERRARVRDDLPAHKLLDVYGAPWGSILKKRRIHNTDVLYIRQPDGIEIYNMIGKEKAYARFRPEFVQKMAQPMHRKISRLFKTNGHTVRVHLDRSDPHNLSVAVEQLDEENFWAGLIADSREPVPEKPAAPESVLNREWQRIHEMPQPEGMIGTAKVMLKKQAMKAVVTTADAVKRRQTLAAEQDNELSASALAAEDVLPENGRRSFVQRARDGLAEPTAQELLTDLAQEYRERAVSWESLEQEASATPHEPKEVEQQPSP